MVFLDDILIYSRNEEEHAEHLIKVLSVLRAHKLYSKIRKCELYQYKITYLVRIISTNEISVDPKNIDAIVNCPMPKNVTDV